MVEYTPRLFSEMDPECKFKLYTWLEKDGAATKKPHCTIGAFEC